MRAEIRARLGLADPLPVQFANYLWALVRFDFGISFTTGQSVASDLWDRLPATLELGFVGLGLGIAFGIPLGVLAAVHRERWPDFLVRGTTLSGMALPQFWVGLVLISIFFVDLRWLPGPVGRLPIGIALPPKITGFLLIDTLLTGKPDLWWMALRQLALPALTLGFDLGAPSRGSRDPPWPRRCRATMSAPPSPWAIAGGRCGSATACAMPCCRW